MPRIYTAGLLCCLALWACRPAASKQAETETTAPSAPAVNEDDLVLRLSVDMVAEPRTQAGKDRNTIINYAIDHLLDLRSTPSGLYYQVIREGKGDFIRWGDRISAHYKGYFLDGRVFDSSYSRGRPLEFYVGNMVQGWNEGLQLLRPGGQALFLLPSALAYGPEGFKKPDGKLLVPPNTVLAFEVEVEPN